VQALAVTLLRHSKSRARHAIRFLIAITIVTISPDWRTMMSSIEKTYENRQAGYTDRYKIEFRRESASYFTIWCLEHPADPYDKDVSHHHLYANGQLCQREGYESRALEHAEAFAYWWMKRWSIYIRTGTFPMTSETVRVPDRN